MITSRCNCVWICSKIRLSQFLHFPKVLREYLRNLWGKEKLYYYNMAMWFLSELSPSESMSNWIQYIFFWIKTLSFGDFYQSCTLILYINFYIFYLISGFFLSKKTCPKLRNAIKWMYPSKNLDVQRFSGKRPNSW